MQKACLYQSAPLAVLAAYSTSGASSDHQRELWLRDHYLLERRELHPVYRHEYSQMRMVSCDSSLFGCVGARFIAPGIPLAKQIPYTCGREGQGGRLYTKGICYGIGNRSSNAHRISLAKSL